MEPMSHEEASSQRPRSVQRTASNAARHRHDVGVNVGTGERAASAAAGATLLAIGFARRGLVGGALGLAGSALLMRGATGHCAVYRRLAKNTANDEPMPREIVLSRAETIDATPQAIRSLLREPRAARALPFAEVLEVDGDTMRVEARLPAGRRLAWSSRIEEREDSITWRSDPEGPFDHALRLDFEPAPGNRGTQVDATLTLRPPAGAAGAAVAQWLRGVGARSMGAALARLKQLCELGEIATTQNQPTGARSRLKTLLLSAQETER
jgi:uncharacterized membrane protein